jgi:CO dehydrogenase nickel-insertion accessory protein CooC1
LLGQLESDQRVVIADMEAGAGTLTRMASGSLDFAVLVVEPSAKSIDVARRASQIIAERRIGMIVIAANRVHDDVDEGLVRDSFPGLEVVIVPDDPKITQADREARSPMDTASDSAAVRAIAEIAARLERATSGASSATPLPVLE